MLDLETGCLGLPPFTDHLPRSGSTHDLPEGSAELFSLHPYASSSYCTNKPPAPLPPKCCKLGLCPTCLTTMPAWRCFGIPRSAGRERCRLHPCSGKLRAARASCRPAEQRHPLPGERPPKPPGLLVRAGRGSSSGHRHTTEIQNPC